MLRFALLAALLATPAAAEEVTLRALSAFRQGTTFYPPFQRFMDSVNAEGKGLVQIQFIGGPETMPPFEVGNALRNGVVDMALTTAVFHANLSPEGLAMTLTDKPIEALRANGGYDLLNAIQERKAGIHWLGRTIDHVPYHIYLAEMPEEADFSGMKLRSTPVYQAFFRDLGAAPVQTAPGEVYTALERGVVDGYGWPAIGIFDEGWQERTAARVEPGFYSTEVGIYLGKGTWGALDDEQRAFLNTKMAAIEALNADYIAAGAAEADRLAEVGVKPVPMTPEAAAAFQDKAMTAGWDALIAASPEDGPKLKALFWHE
ncbi:TRAP transporter substrate-binding protein DctP [Falsirhodobacter sp. 1013]|uniref:TRAP transporter substrate-binding protein DctP n=1 Tax=Falsirhodobacter sp. 1013 TaxID=3417566 RepID=UPI003EB98F61